MARRKLPESIKPFRLVKYFSLTSPVVILVLTLALVAFISQRSRTELLSRSEEYARLVAANLNHQVFLQFVLPTIIQYREIRLSNPQQYQRLDRVIRNTIHGFKIDRVNVYDTKGTVVYSTDRSLVGVRGLGGREVMLASQGKATSRLITRGSFLWFDFGASSAQRQLNTYIPLRVERALSPRYGPILGVFEITQDISDDFKAIIRLQNIIALSSLVVMSLLFLVLRLIVKRAERILIKRTEERRRLEQQLHQAERLAALGEMIAGVSHEIRNPLGIIGSTAELLHDRMDAADPRKSLGKIIVDEAARLNAIVTDFLDFARPMVPNYSECMVEEVLDRNLHFLAVELERRGISVERRSFGQRRPLAADSDLLYRAFLNVLVNAVEAVDSGGTIRVLTRYGNSRQRGVEVVIADNGPGMPGEVQEKVFDPFFTTKNHGTGLGLSIVRNIVESHGGSINIESPLRDPGRGEGGGTAVIISLPAAPQERGGSG